MNLLAGSTGFLGNEILNELSSTNSKTIAISRRNIDYLPVDAEQLIVDFNKLDNGLLGITVQGKHKIRIEDVWKQEDELLLGKIEKINEEDDNLSNDPEYLDLWNMVKEITNHPEIKKLNLDLDLQSSISVCYILASVLPLRPQEKQTILEFENNRDKLDYLKALIKRLGG